MDEVHDFDGPYQIHTTHDGHRLVFVKGVYETFDMSSERLSKIVQQKINDITVELTKWKALQKVMWDAQDQAATANEENIAHVERVDTGPFQIAEIEVEGVRLRISPPLQVGPDLDEETKQVFLFNDDELNIHVASPTRAELYEAIVSDLGFSYREYVLAPDDDLSPTAIEFKRRLAQRLQEEPTGAA